MPGRVGIAFFIKIEIGLVINSDPSGQSGAVVPIGAFGQTISAVTDLSSAILPVVFITVRIFLAPGAAALTGLRSGTVVDLSSAF